MKQELTLEDARLAARVAATLERATQQSDAVWDSRVEQIIAQTAVPPRRSHKWQWSGGLALAASVAFMVAMPSGWLVKTADEQISAKSETRVDGQMLEEIDWLMAMEEASRERR
ncbi:MAG: hypothetical protein VW625_08885 [Perlucidibaca sp.]